MPPDVGAVFSRLRHDKNISQRKAAQELGVSQALLSHYENGIREPRLEFIVRACEYYGVSADYLFGRTAARENPLAAGSPVSDASGRLPLWEDDRLRCLIGSVSGLLTLIYESCGPDATAYAADYLSLSVYGLLRLAPRGEAPLFSSAPEIPDASVFPLCGAAARLAEASLAACITSGRADMAECERKLAEEYPSLYAALDELARSTDEKIASIFRMTRGNDT